MGELITFYVISIHAPVKGATSLAYPTSGVYAISIHAPVKGATWNLLKSVFLVSNFNSRSREGSDRMKQEIEIEKANFNSRSREGSDGRKAKPNYSVF